MIVSLIAKNKICKVNLPENVEGNCWLNYNQKKLINIIAKDDKWQIVCNDNIEINDCNGVDNITLYEYCRYSIYVKKLNEYFLLYCLPSCENNWNELEVKKNSSINIGNSDSNDIIYKSNLVSDIHTKLLYYNGKWMIENVDSRFGTFINSRPILENSNLIKNGDIIFIMGLKIVIMGKHIFINNPQGKVFYNNKVFSLVKHNVEIKNKEDYENVTENHEREYFSRVPRLANRIQKENIKIDLPPQSQEKDEMPLILTLGSSFSMGVIMIISIISAIDGRISGTSTTKQMVFSLITAFVMMISMLAFPILIQRYNRKKSKKKEESRKKKYKEYLQLKRNQLESIAKKQKEILLGNFISEEECAKIVLEEKPRLWERKLNDYDFLNVRVGLGDVPIDARIQLPEKEFSMDEDELVEECYKMVDELKIIKSAPVVIPLTQDNILAVINNTNQKVNRFIHSIVIQLITFHNYEDLKLIFLMDEDNTKSWELVKMLPHVWDNYKQMRFFTGNYDDMKKISQYLVEELNSRLEGENDYRSYSPYYLIITDNYKKIENLKIIKEILKMKTNVGFGLLCLTNDIMQLPNECKTFISLKDDKTGIIFQKENDFINQRKIIFDDSVIIFFDKIARVMSNIPIRYKKAGANLLPENYTFLDMYDVGTIDELNIFDRWRKHDSTVSLKAPVGIDESGAEIVLDIHEKFHGPHGLIAGSTGSGKSEFIITYILSLAINYHPDDVAFVLIDYKGGGLAGAFQKRDIKLPHLVGTITNIDTNGLQRSLMSIQSELRKRQIMFNKARDMTDEGTIDIYKYQKLYHDGIVKTPIPHLLIICDEFAELKQQQPDFMDELISVSRIGRSLGVHLILATQKPSGIVNDQIRSNSKFSICLKVQDSSDSFDVIKRPDAANLKRAGQFYMQVGNNEYFVLGQSGWSGAPYIPKNDRKKNMDDSIELISDIGETIKKTNSSIKRSEESQGEQLTNILKELDNIAKKDNIKKENLWLDNIGENIYLKELKQKYNINKTDDINPVIGEYDDPFNQKQGIVSMNLSRQGNTIIYGNAESGKETLLSTMIYDLITTYNSDEAQIYILDFGSEALKIYKDAPHVGDVVTINEVEKIIKFFTIIQQEIQDRKKELIEYNGDYRLYLKESGKPMPMKVIVINSFETFAEMSQNKFDDLIISLTREGVKCGIVFVMSVSNANDVRFRLLQNFGQRFALQLNNEDGYTSIFEKIKKIRPSHIFGRGLVDIGNNQICEFQTAKICETRQYNILIKETIKKLKQWNLTIASNIPVVPDIVKIEDVKNNLKDLSNVPLGITKKEIKPYIYDFKKNFVTIMLSNNIEEVTQFSMYLTQMLSYLSHVNVCVIDAENASFDKLTVMKNEFNNFLDNLEKNIGNICFIIGIDKFVNEYKKEENFNDKLLKAEKSGICSFVFAENVKKFSNQEYEDWYKQYVSKENGIWVGNGFDSQYTLSAINDRREIVGRCGRTFGYVVKRGKASLIKLVEMKENDEENE